MKKNVLVEISGKSSVVALLKFLEDAVIEDREYNISFIMAYVPSVYDPHVTNNIFALGEILRMHAIGMGQKVENMYYSSESGVWFKAIKSIFNKEFSNPCIRCMAYCHLSTLAFAISEKADVVTGERFKSGKINQYPEMMDFYDNYFGEYDIDFIRPIVNEDNDYVDTKYKEFCELYAIDVDRYQFPKCWIGENSNINKASDETKELALEYLDDLKELMDKLKEESIAREFETFDLDKEEEED